MFRPLISRSGKYIAGAIVADNGSKIVSHFGNGYIEETFENREKRKRGEEINLSDGIGNETGPKIVADIVTKGPLNAAMEYGFKNAGRFIANCQDKWTQSKLDETKKSNGRY